MVEAWRLNKHTIYAIIPADQQLHLFFLFTDTIMPEYEPVKAAILKGMDKLGEAITKTTAPNP